MFACKPGKCIKWLLNCCVLCPERSHSQSTGNLGPSFSPLASMSNCQSSRPVITGKYQHNNDARPSSAVSIMTAAMHESDTELPSGTSSLDARRDAIRQQMVELNRQRLLAQAKVDEIRQQEQQFTQQVSAALFTCTLLAVWLSGWLLFTRPG